MEIGQSEGRFYTKTEHGEAELLYRIEGSVMSIYHTFTPGEERGEGIAEELTKAAFSFAIKNKLKVRPDCPYVAHFLGVHKDMQKYAV